MYRKLKLQCQWYQVTHPADTRACSQYLDADNLSSRTKVTKNLRLVVNNFNR